jgi:alpha-methylacyl-CoA racemase
MSGPLQGIKVVEMAGIGPGPFCAMLLADMGADVVRVERGADVLGLQGKHDVTNRGKRRVQVDLKTTDGAAQVLALVEQAGVLIEGFRPGVTERLGLGPGVCLARNPRLVFPRMTGWGQTGPLAQAAGHDLNYIALSGMLGAMGRGRENIRKERYAKVLDGDLCNFVCFKYRTCSKRGAGHGRQLQARGD